MSCPTSLLSTLLKGTIEILVEVIDFHSTQRTYETHHPEFFGQRYGETHGWALLSLVSYSSVWSLGPFEREDSNEKSCPVSPGAFHSRPEQQSYHLNSPES